MTTGATVAAVVADRTVTGRCAREVLAADGSAALWARAWRVLAGVLAVVVLGLGLVAPQASASAPPVQVPVAVSEAGVALPADMLGDAWDWAKDKAGDAAEWVGDKLDGIAERTGDLLRVASPIGTAAAEAVNDAAEGWVQEALEQAAVWVASTLGRAVAWLMSTALALVFSVNSPNLDADFMYEWSGRVLAFAIPITTLFAFYQVMVTSIQMRGLAGLRRAVGGALFGTAASMVTLPVVAVVSRAVDQVKLAFVSYLRLDTETLSQKLADIWSSDTFTALAETSPTGAAAASAAGISFMLFAFCLVCFFTILFAFGLMVVMVVRNVMLHGVVAMAPLAWSGLAAEPTRAWPRTILGWIGAILIAPVGVVLILGLSVSALGDLDSPETLDALVGQIILAGGMFLLAFFVPMACFRFVSFAGEAAVSGLHRDVQAGMEEGAQAVGDTAKTVVAAAAAAGAGVASGGAGAGGGAAAAEGGGGAGGAAAGGVAAASEPSGAGGGKAAEAASETAPAAGSGGDGATSGHDEASGSGGADGLQDAEGTGASTAPPSGEASAPPEGAGSGEAAGWPDDPGYDPAYEPAYEPGADPGAGDWGDGGRDDPGAQPPPEYYDGGAPGGFEAEETSSGWDEA